MFYVFESFIIHFLAGVGEEVECNYDPCREVMNALIESWHPRSSSIVGAGPVYLSSPSKFIWHHSPAKRLLPYTNDDTCGGKTVRHVMMSCMVRWLLRVCVELAQRAWDEHQIGGSRAAWSSPKVIRCGSSTPPLHELKTAEELSRRWWLLTLTAPSHTKGQWCWHTSYRPPNMRGLNDLNYDCIDCRRHMRSPRASSSNAGTPPTNETD